MLVEGSLDLFEAPSVFKSFIGCKTIEINPLDGWKNSDVIEFQLPRYSEMLYQPSSFKLEMESHIEPTVDPVPPPPPAVDPAAEGAAAAAPAAVDPAEFLAEANAKYSYLFIHIPLKYSLCEIVLA